MSCLQQTTPEALVTCLNINQHSSDLDAARFLDSTFIIIFASSIRKPSISAISIFQALISFEQLASFSAPSSSHKEWYSDILEPPIPAIVGGFAGDRQWNPALALFILVYHQTRMALQTYCDE